MNTQPEDQFDVPPLPDDPFDTTNIGDDSGPTQGGIPTWVWIIAIIVGLLCICGIAFGGIVYVVTQNADEFVEGVTGTLEAQADINVTIDPIDVDVDIDIPTLDPDLIPTLELPTLEPLGESTPDLLPTLEPAATEELLAPNPAPVGDSDYYETFDAVGDWGVGIIEDDAGNIEVSADIEGGVLVFETFIEEGFYWSTAGQNFGDGIYELEVTATNGSEDNGMGMLFFANNETDDFYLFEVSSDGFVWIGFCDDGCAELRMLVDDGWFESDAVNQGIGAKNTLRVDIIDGQMTFYVNDTWVGETFETELTSGDIGVAIESFGSSNVVLEFDNFKYTEQ